MAFEKELEKKAVEIAEKVGEETAKIESEAKEVEEKVLEETVEVIEKVENKMNELAHKNKTQGLTDEELKERDILRKEYIAEFKKGMKKNIMDNLYIMDKDGNKVKVEPKNKKGK